MIKLTCFSSVCLPWVYSG